ncbi:MAG: septum formation protein Maf [Bacteroidota bacterium]
METNTKPLLTKLILGSGSPRRKELLESMGFEFEIRTAVGDETYPEELTHHQITDYLCKQKASEFLQDLKPEELLLTADTIVWHQNSVLGKPMDRLQAIQTLKKLSNSWHKVITSVCFTTTGFQICKHAVTQVKFAELNSEMIANYLIKGNPLDKAGAYGIQEWIGLIGITEIAGSYTNVVGLPTAMVYRQLVDLGYRSK